MIDQASKTLKDVFGFNEFRQSQKAIIGNVLHKKNTLAIMPTGGGKSLCYQIPALLFDGLTVIISPLISLMQDQVRQLHALNIPACVLNSSLSKLEYQDNLQAIGEQRCKLVFLAPETALQSNVVALLKSVTIACIAIDEAHCISEWGHDFRPEYRQLNLLLEQFPSAVCVALTATATPRVRADIKRQLHIPDNSEFIASFDRPNLYLEVLPKDNPYQQCTSFIKLHPEQSGIIYCLSRKQVDELSAKLSADGYSVVAYHAGLSSARRNEAQERFIRDDVHIVVATIAFGMGINKPDVRYVLHYDLPKNIEGYYQQIGRAGRDGLSADCLLLFGYGDTGKVRYFIDQISDDQERRIATGHLNQMLALAETDTCRRLPLLQYFAEAPQSENCAKCDNCCNESKQKSDLTVPAQKFLSCVYRTGERFGASHIIDVLRGSSAEKILQNQHNLLSTYNIGNEYSKKQWMVLSRQLLQKGLLSQDEQFGGLRLTKQAADVLKGNAPFFALLQQATVSSKISSTPAQPGDPALVQILKTERKRIADADNIPPYAVFADRTLNEMAHYFPRSSQSLLKIHGVGQAKLDTYGDIFLQLINDYCQQNNLQEMTNDQAPSKTVKASSHTSPKTSAKTLEIINAFEEGNDIEALAIQHKVKANTINKHLYDYVLAGNCLNQPERLLLTTKLNKTETDKALNAFQQHGAARLKPVFDALNAQITYDQLHLLRVYFVQHKGI
ncbi:DNA helicase RecQ [Paraglaciecola sp. 20A4]|uniref:DNA helicase RecQ n=1 Tax=Paraglaciecola sp. 20A4 TaxID=2687288 RepID=UPI00140DDCC5